MRRRDVLPFLAAWLAPQSVAAQGRPWRIGLMLPAHRKADQEPLLAALRELGYTDGREILVELLTSDGSPEQLRANADALVRRPVDLIIAFQTPEVTAAKRATREIPIVFSAGDPVGTGLVASLARPGGNLTGWTGTTAEIGGKRLELLRELIPRLRRVAVLVNDADPFAVPFRRNVTDAGARASIAIEAVSLAQPSEIDAAFASLRGNPPDAVIVQPSLPLARAAALGLAQRLPVMSEGKAFMFAGGLLSFAASGAERFQHVARYIDRVLKGAKPGDLPVIQATEYELVINLRTAAALGIMVSPSLLGRANEVIE
jgi:putative tryptophan/tyrosine transport system substrate-binding protein